MKRKAKASTAYSTRYERFEEVDTSTNHVGTNADQATSSAKLTYETYQSWAEHHRKSVSGVQRSYRTVRQSVNN